MKIFELIPWYGWTLCFMTLITLSLYQYANQIEEKNKELSNKKEGQDFFALSAILKSAHALEDQIDTTKEIYKRNNQEVFQVLDNFQRQLTTIREMNPSSIPIKKTDYDLILDYVKRCEASAINKSKSLSVDGTFNEFVKFRSRFGDGLGCVFKMELVSKIFTDLLNIYNKHEGAIVYSNSLAHQKLFEDIAEYLNKLPSNKLHPTWLLENRDVENLKHYEV
jgi:hypothetical protein